MSAKKSVEKQESSEQAGASLFANKKKMRRLAINIVIIGILLYVFVPQLDYFKSSQGMFTNVAWGTAAVALLVLLCSYICATLQYLVLKQKPLHFKSTIWVQYATAFTSKLLPANFGTIGLNAYYLHKNKHSYAEAGVVIAVNNILGFVGHMLILSVLILTAGSNFSLKIPAVPVWWVALAGGLIMAILIVLSTVRSIRYKIINSISQIKSSFLFYKDKPKTLLLALCIEIMTSITFMGCLYFSVLAMGISLSFADVAIIFSVGLLAGSLIPAPGGVGGAEAGVTAGLIVYGVSPDKALAAALLYRLISYWIPLVIGFGAFITAQKKQYI